MSSQSESRRRLSVAMIVRDEEEVVGDALSSVEAVADEIIVVDTGSQDRTVQVAQEHHARVVLEPWTDDFAKARNRALREVTGDWVLWLDAGELLATDAVEPLKRFLESEADPAKAYLLTIELPPETRGASPEQVSRIRLVPNVEGIEFVGRIRETLRKSLENQGIAPELTPFRIVRTARDHDPEVKRRKAQRDIRLIELEVKQHGQQPHLLVALAEIHSAIDQPAKAVEMFRAAVAASSKGSTVQLEAYYGWITTLADDSQKLDEQLTVCVEALGIFPFDAQLLCAMGGFLQAQGRPDLAEVLWNDIRAALAFAAEMTRERVIPVSAEAGNP